MPETNQDAMRGESKSKRRILPAEAGGLLKPGLLVQVAMKWNPTSGSWWIIQTQPTRGRKDKTTKRRMGLNDLPASADGIGNPPGCRHSKSLSKMSETKI